LVPDAPITL
jgi:hypothetical protein